MLTWFMELVTDYHKLAIAGTLLALAGVVLVWLITDEEDLDGK